MEAIAQLTLIRICPPSVRLAEDDEEAAFSSILGVVGHVQVGVHAGLEHRDAAKLVEDEFGAAAGFYDFLRRLAAEVQFPLTCRVVIRRIENGFFKKTILHY